MGAIVIKSAMIGVVAALAATVAQWFITGDINPAISGGVAGAVAGATVVVTNSGKAGAEPEG
jgi:hypothetical protein